MQILKGYIELHVFRLKKEKVEFLLLKRSGGRIYPGTWQMVSGRIETGETAVQAAMRELMEETGLVPVKFWVVPKVNSFYTPDNDAVNMVPVFAAMVDVKSKVRLSDEHTDFQWAPLKKACKLLAWPGQREAANIIQNY
ncbi:MAG: NUDIX pyrophosphatase, partial [Ignavibacteriales bacterium]|nr:NUDIX pyrophosphatase [Ignavibacteriales bacterium]